MKFLFSRDLREQPHIRLSLVFYMAGVAIFCCLHWFHEHYTFGLDPATISQTLRGDASRFLRPFPSSDLILEIHVRLFLYVVTLLTVSAVLFRLPMKDKRKQTWVLLVHGFLLFNLLGLVLTRYVASEFAWIKAISFVGLQLCLFYLSLRCLWFLCQPKRAQV